MENVTTAFGFLFVFIFFDYKTFAWGILMVGSDFFLYLSNQGDYCVGVMLLII